MLRKLKNVFFFEFFFFFLFFLSVFLWCVVCAMTSLLVMMTSPLLILPPRGQRDQYLPIAYSESDPHRVPKRESSAMMSNDDVIKTIHLPKMTSSCVNIEKKTRKERPLDDVINRHYYVMLLRTERKKKKKKKRRIIRRYYDVSSRHDDVITPFAYPHSMFERNRTERFLAKILKVHRASLDRAKPILRKSTIPKKKEIEIYLNRANREGRDRWTRRGKERERKKEYENIYPNKEIRKERKHTKTERVLLLFEIFEFFLKFFSEKIFHLLTFLLPYRRRVFLRRNQVRVPGISNNRNQKMWIFPFLQEKEGWWRHHSKSKRKSKTKSYTSRAFSFDDDVISKSWWAMMTSSVLYLEHGEQIGILQNVRKRIYFVFLKGKNSQKKNSLTENGNNEFFF